MVEPNRLRKSWASPGRSLRVSGFQREIVLHRQPTGPNSLNHRDDFSRPALRNGSLNSLSQVAYLPMVSRPCQQQPPVSGFESRVPGSGFQVAGVRGSG